MDIYKEAARRLSLLDKALEGRNVRDKKTVIDQLTEKEGSVYLASRPLYAKGSKGSYVYDQRHIDFSTILAKRLCRENPEADPDIVIPSIIFHDAARFVMPVGTDKIDHPSFNARIIHMYFGEMHVAEHMTKAGYLPNAIRTASRIVGVHDWHYILRFDVDKELDGNHTLVRIQDQEIRIDEMYEHVRQLAESGIRDTQNFITFHDADLINIPAVSSFIKDYLKGRYLKLNPVEFALLRYAYFGLLDDSVVPEGIGNNRLALILDMAKVERVSPAAEASVLDVLDHRMDNVLTGYMDLDRPIEDRKFKDVINIMMDDELENLLE